MTDAAPTVIAIDGPAASGKGTIAQGVARALGFHYLDSGSLYRLVALKALQAGTALDDESGLARVAGRRLGRVPLAVACGVAGFAFGAIMNVHLWVTYYAGHRSLPGRGGGRGPPSAARAAEGVPAAAGAGRRRSRHGDGGLPGRRAQGLHHRQPRGAGRPPL